MTRTYTQLKRVPAPPSGERASHKASKPFKEVQHYLNVDFILTRLKLVRVSLSLQEEYDACAAKYLEGFATRRSQRGELEAVAFYKRLATWYKGKTLGDDPKPIPFTKSKKGWPHSLVPFKKEISNVTVLMYFSSITLFYLGQTSHNAVPDFSSINGFADDVNDELLSEFRKHVRKDALTKRLRQSVTLDLLRDVRVTSAQGIFGQSFYSIPEERKVLQRHPLASYLYRLNTSLGRNFLSDLMFDEKYSPKTPTPAETCLRRVQVLREPGNKLRYITVGDFFSQNTLLPLHNYVMRLLRAIKEDCTYRATEGFLYLQELYEDEARKEYTGFDLTNFTDMLPLSLQRVVLEEFVGENITDLWSNVVRSPVKLPDGTITEFTRGQPMGLLSSWAVATLTHHYLVRWSHRRSGKLKAPIYRLLGDDIVVVGRPAAKAYADLFKLLKIPISEDKTIRSKTGFEFCKRRSLQGKEVTPLPMKAALHKDRDYAAYEILRHMCRFAEPPDLLDLIDFLDKERTSYDIAGTTWITILTRAHSAVSAPVKQEVVNFSGKPFWGKLMQVCALMRVHDQLIQGSTDWHKMLRFDPSKIRVERSLGSKKVRIRGATDRSTMVIYYLVMWTWAVRMLQSLTRLKDSDMSEPDDEHGWAIFEEYADDRPDFYVMDPKKRFQNKRIGTIIGQIQTLQTFLETKTLDESTVRVVTRYMEGDTPRVTDDLVSGWEGFEAKLKGLVLSHSTPLGWTEWDLDETRLLLTKKKETVPHEDARDA